MKKLEVYFINMIRIKPQLHSLHSLLLVVLSFIHSFLPSFIHPSDSDADDRREQPVQPRVQAEELLAALSARARHLPEADAGYPARQHSEDVRQPRPRCR